MILYKYNKFVRDRTKITNKYYIIKNINNLSFLDLFHLLFVSEATISFFFPTSMFLSSY